MKHKIQLLAACLLMLFLPFEARSAFVFLTDTQFTHRGVGVFIGEITAVDVQSTSPQSESGTVQLKVVSVIAGTVNPATITLPYTRLLQPADEASNWDNIAPLYVSLNKVGIGRSLLVYFTVDNGNYFLAPAGNSVQDAASGFLLGKITKESNQQSDENHGCRQVQVEISEVIYGWVGGSSTISLCVDEHSFTPNASNIGQAGQAPQTASGSGNAAANSDCPPKLQNQELFISFSDNKITGVQVATSQQITQLQQIDTQ